LCIIPTKSGSKVIKNKKNKFLIELAFDIAKKSKLFNKIIVSTYSKYQKKIPIDFLRPKIFSGDKVNDFDVMKFIINNYVKFNII